MIEISLIMPQNVTALWPSIEKYMEGAAEYTYGRYQASDILASITDYGHHLWVAFGDDEIKGAVITTYTHYPRAKYLSMTFCGGIELDTWKDAMLKILQSWAFDSQCDGIEATARPGWTKVFKADGHKPLWNTFELPAATAGLGAHHG